MAIRQESELYLPVKAFFERQGFEVRGEVRHCDLVAMRDGEEPVIVELKRTFNLPLLIQGIDRLRHSNRVYLAVEMPPKGRAPHGLKWSELQRLCRMLGLGLLTVRFYKTKAPCVEIQCEPVPYVPRRNKKATQLLTKEFNERSGDYNVGGSNKRKLVTAYREKALQCAQLLRQHGPLSTRQLREMTGNPQITGMLQRNVYHWFERVKFGVYDVTPAGLQALETYAYVLEERAGFNSQ